MTDPRSFADIAADLRAKVKTSDSYLRTRESIAAELDALDAVLLTHLPTPTGLRPVAEIVADVDTLRAEANARRVMAMAAYYGDPAPEDTAANLRAADALDDIAVRLLDPALYGAYKSQHQEVDG